MLTLSLRHSFVKDYFATNLPFTPTQKQIQVFERDLALLNPYIMGEALKEAAHGKALLAKTFDQRRAAIFAIYSRKVAERAQLFPIFHTFETAFRSYVAVHLEGHYERIDWWAPIWALMAQGSIRNPVLIGNRKVGLTTAAEVEKMLLSVEGANRKKNVLQHVANGYELFELTELTWLGRMIIDHWAVFRPTFRATPIPLTKEEFNAKFARIRDARNDVYHHRTKPPVKAVITSAEELLDRIGVCLSYHCAEISAAKVTPLPFGIAPNQAHHIGP